MGMLERLRKRVEELGTLLKGLWRIDLDLNVLQTLDKVLVF